MVRSDEKMTLRTKELLMMKLYLILSLCISTSVLALGDPSFIPATPVDTRRAPPVDAMVDTTDTLNQVEDGKQREEEPKKLDHRYDVPTTNSKEEAHERDHSE
jgi:hypothetical protein